MPKVTVEGGPSNGAAVEEVPVEAPAVEAPAAEVAGSTCWARASGRAEAVAAPAGNGGGLMDAARQVCTACGSPWAAGAPCCPSCRGLAHEPESAPDAQPAAAPQAPRPPRPRGG